MLLDTVVASQEAERLLCWIGDFDVTRREPAEVLYLRSGTDLGVIAGDGSGGSFFLCGSAQLGEIRPLLYASSEGQAGLVASTLREALELLIGIPHWADVLCPAGAGQLDAMLARVADAERSVRDTVPDLDIHRTTLAKVLGLQVPPVEELVRRLHAAVTGTAPDFVPLAREHGFPYEPLCKAFELTTELDALNAWPNPRP